MPYINNRIVHDADSHTMELPDWYDEFGTERVKEVFRKRFTKSQVGALESMEALPVLHKKSEYRELNEKEIMIRKNYQALGAFDSKDRSEAIDHLGVATQLVFPTHLMYGSKTLSTEMIWNSCMKLQVQLINHK